MAEMRRSIGVTVKSLLVVVAALVMVLIATTERLLGPAVSLSVLYLIPAGLVGWYVSTWLGLALIAAIYAGIVGITLAEGNLPSQFPAVLNAVNSFGILAAVLFLEEAFRRARERQRISNQMDSVTGVVHAHAFLDLAANELARARRTMRPCTIAYLDIDDFRAFNDERGHGAADDALRGLVQQMRSAVRVVDVMGRMGGDEFAILLPETDPEQARAAVSKVDKAFQDFARLRGWSLSQSMGVVTYFTPPQSVDEMLKKADGLMTLAKSEGKNAVKFDIVN
jgi:diguanylate cyclase (GGDEF)-like protein